MAEIEQTGPPPHAPQKRATVTFRAAPRYMCPLTLGTLGYSEVVQASISIISVIGQLSGPHILFLDAKRSFWRTESQVQLRVTWREANNAELCPGRLHD
jgi:hypothetical protein